MSGQELIIHFPSKAPSQSPTRQLRCNNKLAVKSYLLIMISLFVLLLTSDVFVVTQVVLVNTENDLAYTPLLRTIFPPLGMIISLLYGLIYFAWNIHYSENLKGFLSLIGYPLFFLQATLFVASLL